MSEEDSKYDWNAIAEDYDQGMSLPALSKKYGISISHARTIVQARRGKLRSISSAIGTRRDLPEGWHKLIQMKTGLTRLISIPVGVFTELGIQPAEELAGKWSVTDGRLKLQIEKQNDDVSNRDSAGWHKLTRVASGNTRLVSIPAATLWSMKLHPAKELIGRWEVSDGNLLLEVHYRDPDDGARAGEYLVRGKPPTYDPETGRASAPTQSSPRLLASISELNDQELKLYQELRSWRFRAANRQSVPEYMILGNDTLATIAKMKPSTKDGLLQLHGIRQRKVDEFGDEIIRIVAPYLTHSG
jgi:hypothetical protein